MTTTDNKRKTLPPPPGSPLVPYLIVDKGTAAMELYQRAFGAKQTLLLTMPDGRIHGELAIGAARLAVSDEYPEMGYVGPKKKGGGSASFMLYVEDADAAVERAVAAGCTLERPIADEFFGDRVGHLVDPFGHRWTLHARIEDVSPEEMQRRASKLFG